ncbi:hypothetical protein BGZ94_004719 [Podila epigama]|nr:hypothetical protein BGZ94_004719 [Podila epigama]
MKFTTVVAALLAPMAILAASVTPQEQSADVEDIHGQHSIDVMSSKTGNLYVKLNNGKNLRDKDWFGKSDPFVEMWLDKSYKQRTKDTKGLNPVFNQTFCFYVRPGQTRLYVRAVDRDTFSNDKIGEATISLSNVMNTGHEGPQDYDLPKWFGLRSNGALNMQMQFIAD